MGGTDGNRDTGGVPLEQPGAAAPVKPMAVPRGTSDAIAITPATLWTGAAAPSMTFIAMADVVGTNSSAIAPLIAGVQPDLVKEFAGVGASLTPQQPASALAPKLEPTLMGSPTLSLESDRSLHLTFKSNG
jgi:hypothetical protein